MKRQLSRSTLFRTSWSMIAAIFAVSAVFIGMALFLHVWKGIPLDSLTCDPVAVIDAPLYVGFLSQIGIFFWSASATVCLFSAKMLSVNPAKLEIKRFLFVSGLFSLLLGLDDIFLIHVQLFPYFGVHEMIVYSAYVGFLVFYLFRFRATILETEYILLLVALLFFGVSIVFDLLAYLGLDASIFEDGAKLVGIIGWLVYFFRTASFALSRRES